MSQPSQPMYWRPSSHGIWHRQYNSAGALFSLQAPFWPARNSSKHRAPKIPVNELHAVGKPSMKSSASDLHSLHVVRLLLCLQIEAPPHLPTGATSHTADTHALAGSLFARTALPVMLADRGSTAPANRATNHTADIHSECDKRLACEQLHRSHLSHTLASHFCQRVHRCAAKPARLKL